MNLKFSLSTDIRDLSLTLTTNSRPSRNPNPRPKPKLKFRVTPRDRSNPSSIFIKEFGTKL